MSDDTTADDGREAKEEPTNGSGAVTTVRITVEDGLWIAADDETGISSQGPTKFDALRNLAATLETVEEGDEADDEDWL
ncbi:hypothetical protein Halru_0354 [Halovivax ruber XH-70]|uniref:DUF1902 domain-containing protein n=1 Tax=Halovivax ruber (strain DSM 18193 / JCM 13892 / XH-70) TaxID=797302 RepID=L0I871_HALRX|nr:hypothetical protein [Halovivax ruber]AGB14998.1 hypothetical protein Halru_0354 [Halovivax ruber XH-70]